VLEENKMNPGSVIQSVNSREDFITFLEKLRANFLEHPDEWKNSSLEDFLEAMAAWVEDMDGYYENNELPVPVVPSWKSVAEMLIAAKIYE
jgi:hypothetical protein